MSTPSVRRRSRRVVGRVRAASALVVGGALVSACEPPPPPQPTHVELTLRIVEGDTIGWVLAADLDTEAEPAVAIDGACDPEIIEDQLDLELYEDLDEQGESTGWWSWELEGGYVKVRASTAPGCLRHTENWKIVLTTEARLSPEEVVTATYYIINQNRDSQLGRDARWAK